MSRHRRTRDHFAERARRENYPARSIYKLEEIDRRVRLIRRGDKILDLGAAPGSWTLYAAEKIGPNGVVVAIDQTPITTGMPSNVIAIEADVLEYEAAKLRELGGESDFDAVISDMAPSTTGHRFVDQSRSFTLFSRAVEIAAAVVRPGGRFTGKIFHGEDFDTARNQVRELFTTTRVMKPSSVRSESYEIYIIGLNKR
ncbi:MAG: RlmE family RNA methyltransferase [Proteobacteria bacterium]|nr:RlmE family RNA methyltransferase [Pseudomonadota bacterium]